MHEKGDFSADSRLLLLAAIAAGIGIICVGVAVVLLKLIYACTNIFYFYRLSFANVSPSASPLGVWAALSPVIGGLIVGLMARYGSDKIRGHGIPEAMEAILFGRSRMEPKVALLKPTSSAIAIGSGGPFGAEGPIIMTGGACASLIAQIFDLSAAERKTLLVAGASGGMTAIFGTPVAAVLLAVEVLLFEWKPRSVVPVAITCAVAAYLRPFVLGQPPLFPNHPHDPIGGVALASTVVVGLLAGVLSIILTEAVYKFEDLFGRMTLHWMWWPAIGGVFVGLGGLLEPRALGVGYDVIADLLNNPMTMKVLLALLIAKSVMWALALGSGTSGGVLAPLLICGGALGAVEDLVLPGGGHCLFALISMAAAFGGTLRAPLTGVIFAFELTHDINALLPLLLASMISYAMTVLVLKRSILTEKVARRGYHIRCEFEVDPLECVSVGDAMTKDVESVHSSMLLTSVVFGKHQGYPVIDDGKLVGIITRTDMLEDAGSTVGQVMERDMLTISPDDTCRTAAERMAHHGVGRLPVVDEHGKLVGIVTRSDAIRARARAVAEEQAREIFLHMPWYHNGVQPAVKEPEEVKHS